LRLGRGPQKTGARLESAGADLGEDLFGVGVLTRSFPRVDEVAVDHDLEYPASRGDDQEFGDLELELF
jgi:hypothetical protein